MLKRTIGLILLCAVLSLAASIAAARVSHDGVITRSGVVDQ